MKVRLGPPTFTKSAAFALLAPPLFAMTVARDHPEAWQRELIGTAYLAAPQLLLIAFSALFAPARRSAWMSVLLLVLTLLLFSFQAWNVWGRPEILAAYVWLLYYPLALAVVVLSMLILVVLR